MGVGLSRFGRFTAGHSGSVAEVMGVVYFLLPNGREDFHPITKPGPGQIDLWEKLNGYLTHWFSGEHEDFNFPFFVTDKCKPERLPS